MNSSEGKKSTAREAKEKVVAEIEKRFKEAKSAVFVDYRGVNVSEITELRVKFRSAGVDYKVYKNNLVRIALNRLGITELDDRLIGTLAVAFSGSDEVAAAKIITDAALKDKMAFKFGIIGTSVLDSSDVVSLASLPSKDTLIGQIMGLVQSGARNIATVLQAVPRDLAMVIGARAQQSA